MLDDIAESLCKRGLDAIPVHLGTSTLSTERWRLLLTVAGKSHNLRLTAAARRLAKRALGNGHPESNWTSHIGIARLVGICDARIAYVAVLEIGEQYCRPRAPLCTRVSDPIVPA